MSVGIAQGAEVLDQQEERDEEAEVADAVGDEGFFACVGGRVLEEEEADEQVGGEADALPADKHEQVVVGQHQGQHEEHEEVEVGEEAVVAALMLHVGHGIDVDEEADAGDDQHHDHREMVEVEAEVDGERIRRESRCRRGGSTASAPELHQGPGLRAGDEERGSGEEERDGGDHGLGEALAEESVDQPAKPGAGSESARDAGNMGRHSLSRFTRSTFSVSRVR